MLVVNILGYRPVTGCRLRYACSPLGCVSVTACVVYGRFDSKIWFENESDSRFDSRFDSNEKNDSQVPRVFGVGLLNDASQILLRPTAVAMATKFGTKSAITRLI